jgi:hypothetical protein
VKAATLPHFLGAEPVTQTNAIKEEVAEAAKAVAEFVPEVRAQAFEILTRHLVGQSAIQSSIRPERTRDTESPREQRAEKPKSSKRSTKESYAIDRNLDLRGGGDVPSFKAFVASKKPSSAKEFNVVALYYLSRLARVNPVTLSQAYTCYVEAGRRPPEHFKQSFIDTKNKEGWIEFDEVGNLAVPHRGVVFVEHDLPREATQSQDSEE